MLLVLVMHVVRLYQLLMHAYTVLLAELHYCPGFGDFCDNVMTAYEATLQHSAVVSTGADERYSME
jgi:hypothetical protein